MFSSTCQYLGKLDIFTLAMRIGADDKRFSRPEIDVSRGYQSGYHLVHVMLDCIYSMVAFYHFISVSWLYTWCARNKGVHEMQACTLCAGCITDDGHEKKDLHDN